MRDCNDNGAVSAHPVAAAFRPSLLALAVIFVISAAVSVSIAGRKGEFGSRYYDIIVSHENETTTWAYLRYVNPRPNPVYVKFLKQYASTGSLATYGVPLKLGVPFFKVVVYFTLALHFLFGFGFACVIYGLFRNPRIAIASIPLAYAIQPYRQIYSCHPWESSMAMAIVPLIFASFGLLMLNRRRLSTVALLAVAPIHLTWFFPAFPIYAALFVHEWRHKELLESRAFRKAAPWFCLFYPIALTAAMHFKMTSGLDFSRQDMAGFWNLVVMRANHTVFFGTEEYYKLFGYMAMLLSCPLLTGLPTSKRLPYIQIMTRSVFYLGAGFLVVQIFGNEFRMSIAANALTPLRIETLLFYVTLFHLFAGVIDEGSPANARLFALFMFTLFLFTWLLPFSFIPICMPLWALLQARLDRTDGFSSRDNLLRIALVTLIIGVLNSRNILPESIIAPDYLYYMEVPFSNLHFQISPTPFIILNHFAIVIAFAVACMAGLLLRRVKFELPAVMRGMGVTVFSLFIFALGAWWLARPHDKAYADIPLSNIPKEVHRFVEGRAPGPVEWREAIDWINANIDRRDVIFTHPDISLNLLTAHKTSLDWGETNLFFYVPALYRDISSDLANIYGVDARYSGIRYHSSLNPILLAAYPSARVKAYLDGFKAESYQWIVEPAGAPQFTLNINGSQVGVKPDFQNGVVRIYKTAAGMNGNYRKLK